MTYRVGATPISGKSMQREEAIVWGIRSSEARRNSPHDQSPKANAWHRGQVVLPWSFGEIKTQSRKVNSRWGYGGNQSMVACFARDLRLFLSFASSPFANQVYFLATGRQGVAPWSFREIKAQCQIAFWCDREATS